MPLETNYGMEEARFRFLIENSADIIALISPEGFLRYLSPAFERILGLRTSDWLDRSLLEIVWPEDLQAAEASFRECLEAPCAVTLWQLRIRNAEGGFRWMEGTGSNHISNPAVGGIVVNCHDVTARKAAEESLRESEARYRRAERGTQDGMWEWNVESGEDYLSPRWLELLGYAQGDLTSHINTVHSLIHPDDDAAVWKTVEEAFRTGDPFAVEMRLRCKDGNYLWVRSRAAVERDAMGRPIRLTGSISDISKEREAGLALQLERDRVRQLNRIHAVLSEVNECIVRERDTQAMLQAACEIIVTEGRFRMAWVGLLDPDTTVLAPVASAGVSDGYPDQVNVDLKDPSRSNGPCGRCLLTGLPALCNDIEHDPGYRPFREAAMRRGYRSSGGFPLKVGGATVGILNLYAEVPGFFDVEELNLLSRLAMDISFALEVAAQEQEKRLIRHRLQETETRYKALFDNAPDALFLISAESENGGQILAANHHAAHMHGYRPEDLLGRSIGDLIASNAANLAPARIRCITPGERFSFEDEHRRKDGTQFPVEVTAVGILVDGRSCVLAFDRDISLRKQAQEALQWSERRFRELAETIEDVFWITVPDKKQVLYVSPAYQKVWGRTPESLYREPWSWTDSIHPDDRARIAHAAKTRQIQGSFDEEYRILRADGSVRTIRDRAFPVRGPLGNVERVLGVARDVTEQRHLEDQLRHSQKMEAFGQLAGGVAHDFNNILTAIYMQTEVAQLAGPLPSEVVESLGEIRRTAERATNLTKQLLLFSRRQVMQKGRSDFPAHVNRIGEIDFLRDEVRRRGVGGRSRTLQLQLKGDARCLTVLKYLDLVIGAVIVFNFIHGPAEVFKAGPHLRDTQRVSDMLFGAFHLHCHLADSLLRPFTMTSGYRCVNAHSNAIRRSISLSVAKSLRRSYSFVVRGSEWFAIS